ncbi:hypothetical protein ACTFIY_005396 [Dictyostelium cf. discoideum]
MKFFAVLCIIFTLAFAYGCNNHPCDNDEISIICRGSCICVGNEYFSYLVIIYAKLTEWVTDGNHYDEFKVNLYNRRDSSSISTSLVSSPNLNCNKTPTLVHADLGNGVYGFSISSTGNGGPTIVLKSIIF